MRRQPRSFRKRCSQRDHEGQDDRIYRIERLSVGRFARARNPVHLVNPVKIPKGRTWPEIIFYRLRILYEPRNMRNSRTVKPFACFRLFAIQLVFYIRRKGHQSAAWGTRPTGGAAEGCRPRAPTRRSGAEIMRAENAPIAKVPAKGVDIRCEGPAFFGKPVNNFPLHFMAAGV